MGAACWGVLLIEAAFVSSRSATSPVADAMNPSR
jgi:hypothetical protein